MTAPLQNLLRLGAISQTEYSEPLRLAQRPVTIVDAAERKARREYRKTKCVARKAMRDGTLTQDRFDTVMKDYRSGLLERMRLHHLRCRERSRGARVPCAGAVPVAAPAEVDRHVTGRMGK
eukprot:gene39499-58825_t